MTCNSTIAKDPDLAFLLHSIKDHLGSDLDIGWGALRQCLVQLCVEGCDLISGNGGRVWAEQTGREGCFGYGDMMGCHGSRAWRRMWEMGGIWRFCWSWSSGLKFEMELALGPPERKEGSRRVLHKNNTYRAASLAETPPR